ncbi:MAG: hypothetical protein ACYDBJ_17520 [Aggregatilineales bacterium]
MKPVKLARRIGCGVLLALWFGGLILGPCAVVTLVSGNEIRLAHSDVPDDNTLRIWLIQQAHERGLGISTGYSVNPDASTVCTVTDTHFVLWQGQGQSSHTCACYTRHADGSYTSLTDGPDACTVAGR